MRYLNYKNVHLAFVYVHLWITEPEVLSRYMGCHGHLHSQHCRIRPSTPIAVPADRILLGRIHHGHLWLSQIDILSTHGYCYSPGHYCLPATHAIIMEIANAN